MCHENEETKKYEVTCPRDHGVVAYEVEKRADVIDHLMIDKEMLQVVFSFDRTRKLSTEPLKK